MQTRPLAEVTSRELKTLLQEECDHWRRELLWDYSEVSSAVAASLDRRALLGHVVHEGDRILAYGYYLQDAGRVVVGSLFSSPACREEGMEELLLDALLDEALAADAHQRIESQTLFCTSQRTDGIFRGAGFESRDRHYLVRRLLDLPALAPTGARLRPMRRDDVPLAAEIIHKSHEGSLDAALNLTYATPTLCRGFVETIVLRAGCGRFLPEASFIAEDSGRPVGVLLASVLSPENGHICQVSVLPGAQGGGTGLLLLTQALQQFQRQGLRHASLSVTVENQRAYRLYARLGFAVWKPFAAHAWARPPARIEIAS